MQREGFQAQDAAVGGHRIRCWVAGQGEPVLLVHGITALRTPIVRELMMAALDRGALGVVVHRGLYDKARVTPELLGLFARPLGTAEGRRALLYFARCLDPSDLTAVEARLPVLVVRADADVHLPAAIAERLHRDLPGSRLVRIPRAGHFLQEDEPGALAEAILAFLPRAP